MRLQSEIYSLLYPSVALDYRARKDLLLPEDHPAVQKDMKKRRKRRCRNFRKFLGKIESQPASTHLSTFWNFEDGLEPRQLDKKAKWIQKHKNWAKEHKAFKMWLPDILFGLLVSKLHAALVQAIQASIMFLVQVGLKDSANGFSRRYPKAAKQVTSIREMQAGGMKHACAPKMYSNTPLV